MGNKIIRILTIILLIMVSVLAYKVYKKSKIKKANAVFNEANEVYINRDAEIGVIEYKLAFAGDKFSLINREKLQIWK